MEAVFSKPAVRGRVDAVRGNAVSGWAQVRDQKSASVRVLAGGKVIAEGVTSFPRADVCQALKLDGDFGFSIPLPADHERKTIIAEVFDGSSWVRIPSAPLPGSRSTKRRYQDFDGTGASKSYEKLTAIRLRNIPNRSSDREKPLAGLSVLDIGCNEGFFCREALKLGAVKVTGIDANPQAIEVARQECPEGTFKSGSWWDIPDEKYDVILFLSAIHYEPRQKEFLEKLADHLTANGTLILECGVILTDERRWGTVRRHDGVKRYPSITSLKRDILHNYAVREAGKSVPQAGDPIPRYVFHCSVRRATVLLLAAKTLSGKTSFASGLSIAGFPVYTTDGLLGRLLHDQNYSWRPASSAIKELVRNAGSPNWAKIDAVIAEDPDIVEELCEIIASEINLDSPYSCIEGDLLRYQTVVDSLQKKLTTLGARPWLAQPLPSQDSLQIT